jgi:hypothetical protein
MPMDAFRDSRRRRRVIRLAYREHPFLERIFDMSSRGGRSCESVITGGTVNACGTVWELA